MSYRCFLSLISWNHESSKLKSSITKYVSQFVSNTHSAPVSHVITGTPNVWAAATVAASLMIRGPTKHIRIGDVAETDIFSANKKKIEKENYISKLSHYIYYMTNIYIRLFQFDIPFCVIFCNAHRCCEPNSRFK